MTAMNINTNLYALSVAQTSVNIELLGQDINSSSVIVYNSGTNPVFIVSAKGSAATAAIPTTGNKTSGKMIPAGGTMVYTKNAGDNFISAISGTGTNIIYISVGNGE